MVAVALKAEEVGLDVFATGEHHNPPFVPSSPTTMLGYIAAQTERLILSTATTLITTNDPVKIAEDYAMLQHLGGRAERPHDGPRQDGPGLPLVRPGHPDGHPARDRELRPPAPPVARGRRRLGRSLPHASDGLHVDAAAARRRALLGWFYLTVLPGWLGLDSQGIDVGIWEVARTVLIFLGIPLAAGYLTRRVGIRRRGRVWYDERFLPRIAPIALYGLLFTIVLLFAIQGDAITSKPFDVARIALPLLAYFALMFTLSFYAGKLIGLSYPRTATLAFTAASNNFELAIAVAVGVFGATSGQALAGVVGPLVEVPVLVALVYVALWLQPRFARSATPGRASP